MQFRRALKVFFVFFSTSSMMPLPAIANEGKYVTIEREGSSWKVISIGDEYPTYRAGIEILSMPKFIPQFDQNFKIVRSPYGGIECPSVPDKTTYTPCNSYFYKFIGANFFGLGGIRQDFVSSRYDEAMNSISADERISAIKKKADEEAEKYAQAQREAAELKAQEQQRIKDEREERARVEARKQIEMKEENLRKMASAERGLEDSCRRTDLNKIALLIDPEFVEVNCQFGGLTELSGLKNSGWLVINKIKDKDGVVTDYYVRKAR